VSDDPNRHLFASGLAAASFHVSADDLSPDELSRQPMPTWLQITIAMGCGIILGLTIGVLIGWLLP